jgi:hypothetical protein
MQAARPLFVDHASFWVFTILGGATIGIGSVFLKRDEREVRLTDAAMVLRAQMDDCEFCIL